MKKYLSLLIFGCTMLSAAGDVPVYFPDKMVIAQHKKTIEKDLSFNVYMRYGIGSLGAALCAVAGYKTLQSYLVPFPITYNKEELKNLKNDEKSMAVVGRVLNAALEKINEFTGRDASITSSLWWRRMGKATLAFFVPTVCAQLLSSGALSCGGYLKKNIFHTGTIEWFIVERTSFFQDLEELEQYVELLSSSDSLSEYDVKMYRYFLTVTVNSLVNQIEKLIGFIKYKQTKFSQKNSMQVQEITRFLFSRTDEFCVQFDAGMKASDLQVQSKLFKDMLLSMFDRFSLIEVAR